MKTYYAILLLLLISFSDNHSLSAQTSTTIDSLLAVLRGNPHDTVRFNSYLSLHDEYVSTDTTQALEYLRNAIELSETTNDSKRICLGFLQLCRYLWKKGRYPEAKQILLKLQHQNAVLKDPKVMATYYQEGGIVHCLLGDYHQAVNDLFKALSHYEALQDTVGISKCYNNIGNAYLHLKDHDQAQKYYQRARELAREAGYEKGVASSLGNLGRIYRFKGEYDQALYSDRQALRIHQKLGSQDDVRIDLHNIGTVYFKLEQLDSALFYFRTAQSLARAIDSKRGLLYANHCIAVIEARLGKYDRAKETLDESLELALAIGMKEEIKNIYLSYSSNYEETRNFEQALDYRKKYEQWNDSLINEKNLNRIKELELEYETAKKDQQLALLTREKEIQRLEMDRQLLWKRTLIGILVFVTILAGLVVYTLRQRLKAQKLVAAKNEEIRQVSYKQQLIELEMKALRAQMNPHFIFNCINSINRMVLSGEAPSASRYLTRFAKLIRMMLENSENPTVSLDDELSMLQAYLQLEGLRFKEKLHYEIIVDDCIDRDMTHLPSMVLQPFIENAIWHGLMPKHGQGVIKIAIQEEEGILKCVIEDNGVGREQALSLTQSRVLKKRSLGLQITEERLKLLNKVQLRDLIRITDLKDSMNRALGTRVDVLIPITYR